MRIYSVKGKRGARWGVDYVDDTGRRIRKVVGSKKGDAEAYLARVRVALERGTYHDPGRYPLTMAELVPLARLKGVVDEKQEVANLQRLANMIGPARQVASLKVETWEEVRARLEVEGCSAPATRNRFLSVLRSTIRLAVRRGMLGDDPLRHARPERVDNARRRLLVGDEEARVWAACRDQQDRTLVALALYEGARCGEIWRARFVDFDFDARTWWLPKTKSHKPRTLPLHEIARREVLALRRVEPGDRLFRAPQSNALSMRFGNIRDRARLFDLRLHDLRRTAATRAIAAGVPIATVMAVLGHADLTSTSHYVVITAEHARAFTEALPSRPDPIPPDGSA